jgi:hypothetical protein
MWGLAPVPGILKALAYLTLTHPEFSVERLKNPTFIPHKSALDLDGNGNTLFDEPIFSSTRGFHNEVPQDIVSPLLQEMGVGTPPPPPLDVDLSGTGSLCPGEDGTWTASVSGGATPYGYDWYYRKDSGTWYSQSETSDSFSRSMPTVNNSMDIKVTVTDDDNTQTSDTKLVYKEGGCDGDGGGGGLLGDDPKTREAGAKAGIQQQALDRPAHPAAYALEQNAPNPARGTVTIRFALPEAAKVSLAVYDVMGREVSRLVDGSMAAGFHDVQYDTSDLASGMYLYRMETPDFTKTRRMTIVR